MTYVVGRPRRRWEIREAVATGEGPRSRTLATFTVLTPETLELARQRATTEFDAEKAINSASRAGARVELSPADRLARGLLRRIADGDRLSVAVAEELREALRPRSHRPEGATWVGASLCDRGTALAQLLETANAFPGEWKPGPLTMPPLRSR